ncbi:hypothetical protein GCM10007913_29760 [Devosia yakushimensis]|uniref:Uncharacterized protein n=1 Tax=Devosia yakushimensis TaxID=470028 RepID=A0ABQ5UG50_9HYPH|nr:hypothetical protein GCM10007913_29760 [Devosia yakushimensis]
MTESEAEHIAECVGAEIEFLATHGVDPDANRAGPYVKVMKGTAGNGTLFPVRSEMAAMEKPRAAGLIGGPRMAWT